MAAVIGRCGWCCPWPLLFCPRRRGRPSAGLLCPPGGGVMQRHFTPSRPGLRKVSFSASTQQLLTAKEGRVERNLLHDCESESFLDFGASDGRRSLLAGTLSRVSQVHAGQWSKTVADLEPLCSRFVQILLFQLQSHVQP
jgi:hypothetical protein